ncbi:Mitogen-activated protein kinase 6 [Cricetulus griseus]|uniref:Mitogen-activated protein kinase 6 n=1 Tax=Cricetulus griseus TaxID=10029 RepID=G3HSC2_CRIGR|nr:Mitogen-activated protein kinase 6 [Cricetulus griseus]ERE65472.1 mitogen-activated protein kinase 6 [Cricetulus griseus]
MDEPISNHPFHIEDEVDDILLMDETHSHVYNWERHHDCQSSEHDWPIHNNFDIDEVQLDPRTLSDVTDEEVQVDPRKYLETERSIWRIPPLTLATLPSLSGSTWITTRTRTIQLGSQHDVVDKVNDLNSSVSQLELKSLISKSVSQEKQEKGMANLAQLEALCQSCWDSQFVVGRNVSSSVSFVARSGRMSMWRRRTYTSYLDKFFSRKEDSKMLETKPVEEGKRGERGHEAGLLNGNGEILLSKQLESIGIPQFHSPVGSPLKSIQATLTPSAMKSSPQIPHKTYSSIPKHLN